MAASAIDPVNAPLPTARNFPFQLAAGNQSSILMSESLDGRSVVATRQKAGSCANVRGFGGATDGSSGDPSVDGTKPPAGTSRASVIVTFLSDNAESLSQEVAASTDGCGMAAATTTAVRTPARSFIRPSHRSG